MARRRTSNVGDPQVVRALALLMEMARSHRGILLKPFAEKRGYPLRGWLPPAVVGPARDELMALFVARHIAPGLRGTSVGRSLDSLWSKLANGGSQQALPLPEVPISVRMLPAIDYSEHRLTLDCLRDAIENRHAVRVRYRRPDGVITDRTIEPGFLHWDGGLEAMYVPSWCQLRAAIRVFAIHRILSIESLPDVVARSVPSRRTIERAFRVWYRDKIEHIQVLFTARVAAEIRERRWHASQHMLDGPEGGVYLHLDVSAPEELERWLLGFGADARVIEPARLADQIQRMHVQAARTGQVIDASEPRRPRTPSSEPVGAASERRARQRR